MHRIWAMAVMIMFKLFSSESDISLTLIYSQLNMVCIFIAKRLVISIGPITSVLTARGQLGSVVSQLARVLSHPGSLAGWPGGGLGSSDVFNNSCVLLQQWGRWTDSGQGEPARSTEERQVLFNFTNCFDIWWLFFNPMKEISLHQTVKVLLVPASFCFGLIFQSVVEPNRENNLTHTR